MTVGDRLPRKPTPGREYLVRGIFGRLDGLNRVSRTSS